MVKSASSKVTSRFILRSVWREFRFYKMHFVWVFLFLIIGFSSVLSVETLRTSLQASIASQSKNFLSADLGISARRDLTDVEWARLAQIVSPQNMSHLIEVYSMVAAKDRARLMQIRVIDSQFPFYGQVLVSGERNSDYVSQRNDLQNNSYCWVYPEVLVQLNLKLGEFLSIAGQKFQIRGVVYFDSANTLTGVDLAPRIYVGHSQIIKNEIFSLGSTSWHSYLVRAPQGTTPEQLKTKISKALPERELRIYTHTESGESAQKMLTYLQDYMGIVSLAILFLALVGIWYILKLDIDRTLNAMQIQVYLGRPVSSLVLQKGLQYVLLFIFASVASMGLVLLCLPLIESLVKNLVAFKLQLFLNPFLMFLIVIASGVIAVAYVLPLMASLIYNMKGGNSQKLLTDSLRFFSVRQKIIFLPLVLLMAGLIFYEAHSFRLAIIFSFGIISIALAFYSVGWLLLKVSSTLKMKNLTARLALRTLSGQKKESLLLFTVVGFGLTLILVLSHIEKSLSGDVLSGQNSERPSLFLFDIQDEQVKPLEELLLKNKKSFQKISPLIRARVVKLNSQEILRNEVGEGATREEDEEKNTQNRAYNLSYRASLDPSETIVEGEYSSKNFDVESERLPEFSAETRFADRMKWKLGDEVTFEVFGVQTLAKLTSLRRIKWTSFQPNFFIQFQPGVFDDVPKSHIASIPKLNSVEKDQIQTLVVANFPNVSMVDVEKIIQKISDLSTTMATVLKTLGLVGFVVGLLILAAILRTQSAQNSTDIGLYQILGLSQSGASRIYTFQRAFLIFGTYVFSFALSVLLTFLAGRWIFDGAFSVDFISSLMLLGLVLVFFFAFERWASARMRNKSEIESSKVDVQYKE